MRELGARRAPGAGGAPMSWVTWVLIVSGVSMNAAAQLLLKACDPPARARRRFQRATRCCSASGSCCRSAFFWGGMVCYAASICVWLAALTKAPVSTAYPMLSLGYVVVAGVSVLVAGRDTLAGENAGNCADLRGRGSGVAGAVRYEALSALYAALDRCATASRRSPTCFAPDSWRADPKVQAFEAALAAYLGPDRHVRVMTSATAGLEMALEVAGIGEGDEVIVPAMSFAASANVVARVRAEPVFVDIDLYTRNLNLDLVQRRDHRQDARHHAGAFRRPARGHGRPLRACGRTHGLRVVEDAAHAIGSRYRGKLIGSFGDLVVFSFHPNKNMTSIEGGAICHGATLQSRGAVRAVPLSRHQAQCGRARST